MLHQRNEVAGRSGRAAGRGFTLIELLVVVAIIAVLISILLPSLSRARENAKTAVCQTRMRAWGLATHEYASLNNYMLPHDGGDGTTAKPIGRWDDMYLWWNGLTAMTKSSDIMYNDLQDASIAGGLPLPKGGGNSLFVCPSAGEAAPGGSGATADSVINGYFSTVGWKKNPLSGALSPFNKNMLLCYAFNSQIRKTTMSAAVYPPTSDPGDVAKLDLLIPMATTVLFAEKRIRPDELLPGDANIGKELAQNKIAPNRFASRHKSGGNICYADGHVEFWTNADVNKGTGATAPYNQPGIIWTPGLN